MCDRGSAMQSKLTKQEAIEEITRRLVDFYNPARIYLFGSEARGEAGPDSDLDFLVVVPDDTSSRHLHSPSVYSFVSGTGYAKDIVAWRKTDFEMRAAHVASSLPATVVREGKILYEAA
jgi:predicted nucleotidyltransferase